MGCSASSDASAARPTTGSTRTKGQMNMGYWSIRGMFRGQVARFIIAYSGAPCKEITY